MVGKSGHSPSLRRALGKRHRHQNPQTHAKLPWDMCGKGETCTGRTQIGGRQAQGCSLS